MIAHQLDPSAPAYDSMSFTFVSRQLSVCITADLYMNPSMRSIQENASTQLTHSHTNRTVHIGLDALVSTDMRMRRSAPTLDAPVSTGLDALVSTDIMVPHLPPVSSRAQVSAAYRDAILHQRASRQQNSPNCHHCERPGMEQETA